MCKLPSLPAKQEGVGCKASQSWSRVWLRCAAQHVPPNSSCSEAREKGSCHPPPPWPSPRNSGPQLPLTLILSQGCLGAGKGGLDLGPRAAARGLELPSALPLGCPSPREALLADPTISEGPKLGGGRGGGPAGSGTLLPALAALDAICREGKAKSSLSSRCPSLPA